MKPALLITLVAGFVWGSALPATGAELPDSQYVGSHYVKKAEPFRKCVMKRESGGSYKADGSTGSGVYQFIQSTWDVYAQRAGYPEWVGVRPYKAPRYVQDEVFWIAVNPYSKRPGLEGRHHWSAAHAQFKVKDC